MMIPNKRHNTWFLSCVFCTTVVFLFGIAQVARGSDELLHWFMLPLGLCGILVAEDAAKWLKGDVDVFDPVGVLGLFGVHFFFLAPLLHVHWSHWMSEVAPPEDWRPWLGGMAALNCVGLLAYRATRAGARPGGAEASNRSPTWRLRPRRFRQLLFCALLLAAALQVWTYARYGGLWGYISAVEQKEHAFLASSRIAMISEAFPTLALMGYAVHLAWIRKTPSWAELFFAAIALGAAQLLFGGLHGSRSNTVFAVFWAVGIIHLCIRPVPQKFVLGGALALVIFMYMYGFYKSGGVDGLERALASTESRADVESEIHRPVQSTILSDLGRADVQGYLLYRLTRRESDYEYAFGRTYLGAALRVIPGPLWRNRPPTKVKEGTEALHGRGSYRERPLSSSYDRDRYIGMSSRVYGLAGEAMLNFGPLGVPVAFALLGAVVGRIRYWLMNWNRRDPRRLILPLLVTLCLVFLIGDSDNILALLQGDGLFPFLIVVLASRRFRPAGHTPSGDGARDAPDAPAGMQREDGT